jgi:hypothetical protein
MATYPPKITFGEMCASGVQRFEMHDDVVPALTQKPKNSANEPDRKHQPGHCRIVSETPALMRQLGREGHRVFDRDKIRVATYRSDSRILNPHFLAAALTSPVLRAKSGLMTVSRLTGPKRFSLRES